MDVTRVGSLGIADHGRSATRGAMPIMNRHHALETEKRKEPSSALAGVSRLSGTVLDVPSGSLRVVF